MRVAVLDSGVDYTHKNLGGPGTVADYDACYAQKDVAPDRRLRRPVRPGGAQGGRRLRLRRRDLAQRRRAHRGPEPDRLRRATARTWPTSSPARARTARTRAWRRAPSSTRSRSAARSSTVVQRRRAAQGDGLRARPQRRRRHQRRGRHRQHVAWVRLTARRRTICRRPARTRCATASSSSSSAGNSADRPYIVGSPSIDAGSDQRRADAGAERGWPIALVINSPATIAGVYTNTATAGLGADRRRLHRRRRCRRAAAAAPR